MARKHRLLIGGLGDDAHSVGIWLLALGFKEEGFLVRNLGIRNDVADFMRAAQDFDLIMISNNNGHAELYLQDFGQLLALNYVKVRCIADINLETLQGNGHLVPVGA